MRVTLTVLNHDPVPLRPLGDFLPKIGEVFYLVPAFPDSWLAGPHSQGGWFLSDDGDCVTRLDVGMAIYWDDLDTDRSLYRQVQPGEIVKMTYERGNDES